MPSKLIPRRGGELLTNMHTSNNDNGSLATRDCSSPSISIAVTAQRG